MIDRLRLLLAVPRAVGRELRRRHRISRSPELIHTVGAVVLLSLRVRVLPCRKRNETKRPFFLNISCVRPEPVSVKSFSNRILGKMIHV